MNDAEKAIKILKKGGIVIFPTDTAFGIGCRIDKTEAIEKLFKIRRRPKEKAVSLLVDSIEMASKYLEDIPNEVLKLMKDYWPGALTIILCCIKAKVPSLVRGGGKTIGVRMPDHETTLSLIKGTGVPILGPSANFHGEKTPYSFEELDSNLIRLVDYVVKGECKLKKASTVIDCSIKPWKVLRQGELVI
ncbi:L-threonylcarbamoyladenylate synthase [Patescibacteria group bacterium]|nr:L-threonylcarbamoyladenylate synthase [Patescibacteria group bacterium]MCL5010156.1 L-threonylcarbamoyladenylate synthase [Patescibacteria group bacterium]